MGFKIDTKETYTGITPETGEIDANLTATLLQKCTELGQSGSLNYIIDLSNCLSLDNTSFDGFIQLHNYCYSNGQSIVFAGIKKELLKQLKQSDAGITINLAPTEKEAIDIISMEILERDLFNEES